MTSMFYGKRILHVCGYGEMILFQQLRTTLILIDHEISYVEKLISLSFHAYEERLNQRLYTSCASI
jgi:hypothetical protein